MSKFCKNCGKEVIGKFCEECGTQMDGDSDVKAQQSVKGVEGISEVPKKKNGCLIFVVIVILIIAALITIGNNAMKSFNDKKENGNIEETNIEETNIEETNIEETNIPDKRNESDLSDKEEKKEEKEEEKEEEEEKKADLEVLSQEIVDENYVRYIVGQIKNNTNKSYSYVQVQIKLYKGGSVVGSTMDNISNLDAGEVWEFKAPILEKDCDTYKIEKVTGF